MGSHSTKSTPAEAHSNLLWSVKQTAEWEARTHVDRDVLHPGAIESLGSDREALCGKYLFTHTLVDRLCVAAEMIFKEKCWYDIYKGQVSGGVLDLSPKRKLQVERRMHELNNRLVIELGNWDHARYAVEWLMKDYTNELDILKVKYDMISLEEISHEINVELGEWLEPVISFTGRVITRPAAPSFLRTSAKMEEAPVEAQPAPTAPVTEETTGAKSGPELLEALTRKESKLGIAEVGMYRPETKENAPPHQRGVISRPRLELFTKVNSDDPHMIKKELETTLRALYQKRADLHHHQKMLVGMAFMDASFSGSVEPDEIPSLTARLFTKLDYNKDSRLSPDDILKSMQHYETRTDNTQQQLSRLGNEKQNLQGKLNSLRNDGKLLEAEKVEVDLMKLDDEIKTVQHELNTEHENFQRICKIFKTSFDQHVLERLGGDAKHLLDDGQSLHRYVQLAKKVENCEAWLPDRLAVAARVAPAVSPAPLQGPKGAAEAEKPIEKPIEKPVEHALKPSSPPPQSTSTTSSSQEAPVQPAQEAA